MHCNVLCMYVGMGICEHYCQCAYTNLYLNTIIGMCMQHYFHSALPHVPVIKECASLLCMCNVYVHTHIHANIICTLSHTNTCSHIHTHTHTQTHTGTHIHTHIHTHKHTHNHTHIHTHTYTHKHTQLTNTHTSI